MNAPERVAEFAIVIEPDEDGFLVRVPAVKGCQSFGLTRDEARANMKEAIEGWLETAAELGIPIPEPESVTVTLP